MHPEISSITPIAALFYSFLLGVLHGVIPDEHTWPITFSYTVGGVSSRAGFFSGLYFSLGFTIQRMILSQISYLALAPILLSPLVDSYVYTVVGFIMTVAGLIMIRKNRLVHKRIHLRSAKRHLLHVKPLAPPVQWTFFHGFIAGFGFDALSIYVNTIAVSAMPALWAGFLPGLMFGFGTMISLVTISWLFGALLKKTFAFSEEGIRIVGALTSGRILFFGGIFFVFFGSISLAGFNAVSGETGYLLIGLFMFLVAVPVFVFTLREVKNSALL